MTLHEMHALTIDDQSSIDAESGPLSAVWSLWGTCA